MTKSSGQGWVLVPGHQQRIRKRVFHHFAYDSSALKRLRKFVVVRCNCVHGKKFSHFIWAFTLLQLTLGFVLGFGFWFLVNGFVLG